MKNVFNKRRILTLLLSLFIMLGLAFALSGNNKVNATNDVSYLEDFYKLTYKDGNLELMFSADVLDYEHITKSDITTLKDRLIETFKEVIKDSVKENYNYTNVSRRGKTNGGFVKLGLLFAPTPYDEIDISTLTNIVKLQLIGKLENIDNFLNGTMYDTMVNYYIDNYVTKFLNDHPTANANDALDEIEAQLYAATQFSINTTYDLLGIPAPDSYAKVKGLVDEVRATKAADEKIEVTLSDVTDMMTIIDDSSTIIDVITELDVDADVQTVINNANAEDIVDFLTTVDVETIVDVVTNTDIMESTDLETILTNLDADDIVTIAESLDVDGIIDIAKAAGVTSDSLTTILEDKFAEVDLSDVFRFVKGIELDGTTVYENGGFNYDGILTILKGLPKPAEIANFTDGQMNLQYQLVIKTSFGDINMGLKVGFYGDCSKVRKLASLIADHIEFDKDGSTYTLKVDAPEALSKLIRKAITSDVLSDELKQRLLNDSALSVSELYELVQATSREEYIELLKEVNYEKIFKYVLDADNLNAQLGTNLTNSQIDKAIDKMLKLADKTSSSSSLTITNLVDIFSDYIDVSSIPTEKLDKALNKALSLLKSLVDKDLTAATLRTYVDDESLNEKIIANLDNLDADGDKFNTLKSYLTKLYNKLPERLKDNKLVDLYEGEGVFHYNGSGNLQELVRKLMPDQYETKSIVQKIINKIPTDVTVDVTLNLPGLHKVEYNYGDEVKTLFLPSGLDLAFCSGVEKIGEYDIVLWVDADNNEVETTLDEDIVVYAVTDFELETSEDVTATYDPNTEYELKVTAKPDTFTYTYQWYKDDALLEGKTEATLTVKDVADSGTYKCKVSNGYFEKDSDEIVVAISKAVIDLSGLTWNYTEPFTADGTEKKVEITNAPEEIDVAYTDNAKTEAGSYNAVATFTLKAAYADNYELSTTSATLAWVINPAAKTQIDVSTFTWDYTNPFTYDGNEKKVQINNLPEQVEVAYTDNAKTAAGTYTATATFTIKAAYADTHELSATSLTKEWKINKASLAFDNLTWDYTNPFTYDGTEKKVQLTNAPEQVDVAYTDNAKTAAGTYTATATFTLKAAYAANYDLATASATKEWKINKAALTFENLTWNYTAEFEYDGTEKKVELTSVPEQVDVAYTDNAKTEAGTYTAVATFTLKAAYAANYELQTTKVELIWKIKEASTPEKIQIDVSGVAWDYTGAFEYDGTQKTVTLKNIPAHVKVEYSGEYQKTEAGTYAATATLSPETDEYELVGTTTLTLNWEIKAPAGPEKQKEFSYGDRVIVTAVEGLDAAYQLNVRELEDFNRDIKPALDRHENGRTRLAYEIHFNKDGVKAQVNGEYTVKIKLTDELKAANIKLIHFTDDNDDSSATSVEFTIEGDYIVFTTDGFSDFAIAEVKTAPYVPIIWWIILAIIIIAIIILLVFLLKKKTQYPNPVAEPFEKTYFVQLVNADDDVKARYYELKNAILEKKKDDESFKCVMDEIHEGFGEDPEVVTFTMVDGMLYVKVNEETFEMESDCELKKCMSACTAALGGAAVAAATEEQPAEEEAPGEEEQPAEEEAPAEEEQPAEEEAPAEEEQPAEEEAPAEEEQPAEEAAPAEEEQPAEEAAPTEEEQPAEEATPAEEEQPAEEAAPAEEEQPAEEAAPAEEEQPAEEAAPAEEEQPAEEAAPAEEEQPAEEDDGQEVSAEDLAADGVTDEEPDEEAGEESEEELAAEEAEEKEKKQKTVYHVSKRDKNGREWKVFKQGSKKVIKLFGTQKEALDYAKSVAKNKADGSYVLLHGLDGKMRKY